jgi:hypothetical protein
LLPSGLSRYPLIGSGVIPVGTITLQTGSSLTLNGTGILQVEGTITGSGTIHALNGTLEMSGSEMQTINGSLFVNNTIQNIIISNHVTLSGTINITGRVSFGNVNNKTFTSNGFLVLKSTVSGTAVVADVTNSSRNTGNTISGNVMVERYIPAGRKWRGLSAPLKGSVQNSIFDNWQNGGIERTGTGALLWSPSGTGASGNGFSRNTNVGASANIRGYSVSAFTIPTSTKSALLFNQTGPKPYLVFVTDQYYSNGTQGKMTSGASVTTLKASGELITGSYTLSSLSSGYQMIANPYASPIDFATLGKININNQFWVWDPKLFGFSGYGGYVYTSSSGAGYISSPIDEEGSYTGNSSVIPAGAAFWVSVNDGFTGSLSFAETDKTTGGYAVFGGRISETKTALLRVNLKNTAGNQLYDGITAGYDDRFSELVDQVDVKKFGIGGENISIRRNNLDLAMEFRPAHYRYDTLFLRLHNMQQKDYILNISGSDFDLNSGVSAVLQDLYLNTETKLDLFGKTAIAFNVSSNITTSNDRFRIVFRKTDVTSVQNRAFEKGISLYPNPVVKGSLLQVEFNQLKAGTYKLLLYNLLGSKISAQMIQHIGGTSTYVFSTDSNLSAGTYIMDIRDEKGASQKMKLTIQ